MSANKWLEDIVLAHRYLFHVARTPTLSDYDYGTIKNRACKTLPLTSPVHLPSSTIAADYPPKIVALANKYVKHSNHRET